MPKPILGVFPSSRRTHESTSTLGLLTPTTSTSPITDEPKTPPPRTQSRNDLFSFNWSPVSPNVSSARNSPVLAPAPIELPKVQTPPIQLPPSPVSPVRSEKSIPNACYNSETVDPASSTGLPRAIEMSNPASARFAQDEELPEPGTSKNPVLDSRQAPRLRLNPSKEFCLGEGRHSSVYLASFIPRESEPGEASAKWKLCAAKRLLPDRESQIAGLGEAFLLSKLNATSSSADAGKPNLLGERGSRSILQLYGVRDERDGVEIVEGVSSRIPSRKPSSSSINRFSVSQEDLAHSPKSNHFRSVSDSMRTTPLSSRRKTRTSLQPTLSPPLASPTIDIRHGLEDVSYFDTGLTGLPRPSRPHELPTRNGTIHSSTPHDRLTPSHSILDGELGRSPSARVASPRTQTSKPPRRESIGGPRMVLITEFCPFGSASSFSKRYPERMGKRRWLAWAREVTSAVAWMHARGIVHADIKPQNILVASDLSVRLADFGMSRFLPPPGSSAPPVDPIGLGTPAYSAPEQVNRSEGEFSFPADVFSLGVTLSVLITGREPYEGLRTVERMWHVGRGGYWEWEERVRLGGVGTASRPVSRTGSIRSVRSGRSLASSGHGSRLRSDSAESSHSGDLTRSSWATALLAQRLTADSDDEGSRDSLVPPDMPSYSAPPSPGEEATETSVLVPEVEGRLSFDEEPLEQHFLNGQDVVPANVRRLLQAMTSRRLQDRPSALTVLKVLDELEL